MATNIARMDSFYKSDRYVSDEFKINQLAMMLAAYDASTWSKLSHNKKLTYIRAASNLFRGWGDFCQKMETWKAKK